MKTITITAIVKTNLNLTSEQVKNALERMLLKHENFDRDETVAAIPTIKLKVGE